MNEVLELALMRGEVARCLGLVVDGWKEEEREGLRTIYAQHRHLRDFIHWGIERYLTLVSHAGDYLLFSSNVTRGIVVNCPLRHESTWPKYQQHNQCINTATRRSVTLTVHNLGYTVEIYFTGDDSAIYLSAVLSCLVRNLAIIRFFQ